MPTVPNFPSIPIATEDPKSLLESVIALKQTVEMLTGQDVGASKFATHTFVQLEVPEALHIGDLWLCTGPTYTFNVWNGLTWLKLGNVMATREDEQPYFQLHQFMRRRGGG